MRSIHIDNEELFSVIDYAEEVGVESSMFEEYLLNGPEDYFLFLETLVKEKFLERNDKDFIKKVVDNIKTYCDVDSNKELKSIIEDFYSNILLLRNYEVWCHKVGYAL